MPSNRHPIATRLVEEFGADGTYFFRGDRVSVPGSYLVKGDKFCVMTVIDETERCWGLFIDLDGNYYRQRTQMYSSYLEKIKLYITEK